MRNRQWKREFKKKHRNFEEQLERMIERKNGEIKTMVARLESMAMNLNALANKIGDEFEVTLDDIHGAPSYLFSVKTTDEGLPTAIIYTKDKGEPEDEMEQREEKEE